MEEQYYDPFEQIKLNSSLDILIETILTYKYNVTPYENYLQEEDTNMEDEILCSICLEPLKNTYVLQYPCDTSHIFHRNCIISHILNKINKNNKSNNCPICMKNITES
jgi:hypothetical protein